jgi:hypothetical protein
VELPVREIAVGLSREDGAFVRNGINVAGFEKFQDSKQFGGEVERASGVRSIRFFETLEPKRRDASLEFSKVLENERSQPHPIRSRNYSSPVQIRPHKEANAVNVSRAQSRPGAAKHELNFWAKLVSAPWGQLEPARFGSLAFRHDEELPLVRRYLRDKSTLAY